MKPKGILPDEEAPNLEFRATIRGWEILLDKHILDPDGFDRSDPDLMKRLFTRTEFYEGLKSSTQRWS